MPFVGHAILTHWWKNVPFVCIGIHKPI
jgi:hypothetical protein